MAYSYKRTITCGNATGSAQTNFPLLIKLDASNCGTTMKTVANGGHIQNTVTQTGGNAVTMPADLIFTSDSAGSTKIPWEVESYDAVNGVLWVWVLIASLSNTTGATIYGFYGDAAVNTQQNTSAVSPSHVWDANFLGIYHLPDGSSLKLSDSTATGFTLTNNGTATAATGQIDGCVALASASSQYLSKSSSAYNAAAMTVSCWVKASSFPGGYNTVVGCQDNGPTFFFDLHVKSTGKLACYVGTTNVLGENYDGSGSNTLSVGTWYHLALTYVDGTGIVGYVNGASDGTSGSNGVLATPISAVTFNIGNDSPSSPTRFFNGSIDEVRVSNIARSANWISTEYNSQNNPLTFNAIGSEQSTTPGVLMDWFVNTGAPVRERNSINSY